MQKINLTKQTMLLISHWILFQNFQCILKIEINPVLKLDHFPMAIEVKIEANMANDHDQGGISSIYKWRSNYF